MNIVLIEKVVDMTLFNVNADEITKRFDYSTIGQSAIISATNTIDKNE